MTKSDKNQFWMSWVIARSSTILFKTWIKSRISLMERFQKFTIFTRNHCGKITHLDMHKITFFLERSNYRKWRRALLPFHSLTLKVITQLYLPVERPENDAQRATLWEHLTIQRVRRKRSRVTTPGVGATPQPEFDDSFHLRTVVSVRLHTWWSRAGSSSTPCFASPGACSTSSVFSAARDST